MTKADFALQWLNFLGTEVYNKGEQILKYYDQTTYEISPLKTRIQVGQQLGDENETTDYTRMSFPEFENLGFMVVTGSDYVWKPHQRYHYRVQRKRRDSIGITADSFSKAGLQIQHDPANRRIRLVGDKALHDPQLRPDSGIGPWIIYDEDKPIQGVKRNKTGSTKEEFRAMMRGKFYGVSQASLEYVNIDEIPVLFSDEKYIVCIKRERTCQRIIVVGQSGKGKSLAVNSIAGRIFYKWQDRVGWLIDPLNQFQDLSSPQDFKDFNKINALINDVPKPMPAIQLYLACRNKIEMKHPNISLKVTLSFEEFLRKYKFYTHGIKDLDVGDTIRYLNDYIKEIKDVRDAKEIMDVMMKNIPNAEKDTGKQAMIYKWKNTFDSIFKEKFTSNLYYADWKTTDELEVRFREGNTLKAHPFIALMEAGTIPVMNIAAARRQRWLRNYLADLMQKIVRHQSYLGDSSKRMWIVADELNEIYEIGKKKDKAFEAFEELYRQGRFNNIGFIGNTQSLDRLNPEMYKNATHIACVYMKDHKERKRVGDTFALDKQTYNMIESLKELEMMIFSAEPFIIYDRWGRRKEVTDRKWFKGRIIPPINHHSVPGG